MLRLALLNVYVEAATSSVVSTPIYAARAAMQRGRPGGLLYDRPLRERRRSKSTVTTISGCLIDTLAS